ncbi:MAG: hypothetical protein RLY57_345 [Candidatus Parcubacteria bacterium]|jgi:Tfp pilus assembly protein PilN
MLHLLPSSYVHELQKEYQQRTLVTAAKLVSFCLLVVSLALVPSLILVNTEQSELNKQSVATTLRISDEDKATATQFKSAVNQGLDAFASKDAVTSADIDQLLGIITKGISVNALNVAFGEKGQEVEIQGIADNRSDLSYFVRTIATGGVYIADEIPAATFKKDKDIEFSVVLKKQSNQTQQ